MAIDRKILNEFREQMRNILNQVDFSIFRQVYEDRLLDIIQKHPSINARDLLQYVDELMPPEFAKFNIDVFGKYNYVLDTVNELYQGMGVDVQRDFSMVKKIEQINQLRLGKYEEKAIEEVKRELRRGIKEKLSVRELSDRLKTVDDKVQFYSDTIAQTQLSGYARLAKNEKANLGGVFYYQYVGVLREKSRDFCIIMLNKTMHIKDINKLDAGTVGPAFISPCIVYCGGWNCTHDWEPDPFYEG